MPSESAPPTRADVLVVGSGAGGAPLAAILAEAGLEVLLLEAGPRVSAAEFSEDEAETSARLGRLEASEDGAQTFYAGACVGGSTVLNDALCWRPPPEILAGWRRDHGLGELDADAFAPFVERAWRDLGAEPTGRALLNRNAWMLERGAARLGWAAEAMPRSVNGCAGLGRCNLGCPIDAKQSTVRRPPLRGRGDGRLGGGELSPRRRLLGRARPLRVRRRGTTGQHRGESPGDDRRQRPARRRRHRRRAGPRVRPARAEVELARSLAALDRRGFLRLAGLAAAAGWLPAGCRGAPGGAGPPPDLALRVLSPRSYAVVNAATERIVGDRGRAALRDGRVDPGSRADAYLAHEPGLAELLEQALFAVEFGVFPLVGKLRPFTALDAPARDAVLHELMGSRWSLKRNLFKGVKSIAVLAFYGSALYQPVTQLPGVAGVGVRDALRYDP